MAKDPGRSSAPSFETRDDVALLRMRAAKEKSADELNNNELIRKFYLGL